MMTKINLFFVCIFLLIGCSKEVVHERKPSDVVHAVRFRLAPNPKIDPFPDTKSIPQKFPPEPVPSKGGDSGISDNVSFSHIEYAVYDAVDNTLVHHFTFSEDDESLDDFGVFIYDTLKAGDYKICILTHSVPTVNFTTNKLTFPDIADTFYGSDDFEVSLDTKDIEKEILLKRIVSKVEFVAKDPVPDMVEKFHLSVPGRYNVIDMFTGKVANETIAYTSEHTFLPEERGENIFNTHAYFTLVPSGENITLEKTILTAKDDNDDIVRQRTIDDIPIIANRVTRYTGVLYTPGSLDDRFDLVFENDGKWGEPIETELPED